MSTAVLFPDAPGLIAEGGRRYVPVPWDQAEALRAALHKHGCPTTLYLNPETREARLELWPDVAAEAVLAVLEARLLGRPASPSSPTVRERPRVPAPVGEPTDLICI